MHVRSDLFMYISHERVARPPPKIFNGGDARTIEVHCYGTAAAEAMTSNTINVIAALMKIERNRREIDRGIDVTRSDM